MYIQKSGLLTLSTNAGSHAARSVISLKFHSVSASHWQFWNSIDVIHPQGDTRTLVVFLRSIEKLLSSLVAVALRTSRTQLVSSHL
jgi:hypothetical protein